MKGKNWGAALESAGGAKGAAWHAGANTVAGGVAGGLIDGYMGNDSWTDGAATGAVLGGLVGAGVFAKKVHGLKVGSMTTPVNGLSSQPLTSEQLEARSRQLAEAQKKQARSSVKMKEASHNQNFDQGKYYQKHGMDFTPTTYYGNGDSIDNILKNSKLSLAPKEVSSDTASLGMPSVDFKVDQSVVNASYAKTAQRRGFGY